MRPLRNNDLIYPKKGLTKTETGSATRCDAGQSKQPSVATMVPLLSSFHKASQQEGRGAIPGHACATMERISRNTMTTMYWDNQPSRRIARPSRRRVLRHLVVLLGWAFLLPAAAGCTSLNIPKDMYWPWDKDKPVKPVRLSDVWTYTVLRQPNQPGIRGFGGRIMFFGKDDKTTKIDGTITVYAFDANAEDPSQAEPERKFVFPGKDLEKRYQESKVGHSYNVWLPWDEVGGEQRQLVLVTRLETKDGEVVMGAASRQLLSGAVTDANGKALPNVARAKAKRDDGVCAVSYVQEIPKKPLNEEIGTTTINIPPSFAHRTIGVDRVAVDEHGQAWTTHDSGRNRNAAPSESEAESVGIAVSSDAAKPKSKAAKTEPSSGDSTATAAPMASDSSQDPELSTRFGPQRLPARRGTIVEPRTDPIRRQPYRGRWPSALPSTPRSAQGHETPNTAADVPLESTASDPNAAGNMRN